MVMRTHNPGYTSEQMIMDQERDIKVMQVAWSPNKLPLFELAVKFPLPFLVKSAATSGGSIFGAGGRILAGEIYRMQRLLRVQKVLAQIEAMKSLDQGMEIDIPKDYHGPFQVLRPSADQHASIKDIMESRPRFIKVVQTIPRKASEVQLDEGDVLEVLGTTMRLTKTGVIEFLRLRKKHREFVLHPDFIGNFEILEDNTQYTLTEILDRFPLPQRVSISNPDQHSETLLNKLPSRVESDDSVLVLKRELQKEYVIGVDMYGRIGVVVDMDADTQFFLPDTNRNHLDTNENDIIHRILAKTTLSVGELRMDQIICQKDERLILCKPWQQLFKDLPPIVPFRRPSEETLFPQSSVSSGSETTGDKDSLNSAIGEVHHQKFDSGIVDDSDSGHDTLDEETLSTGKLYGPSNILHRNDKNTYEKPSNSTKSGPGHDRRTTLSRRTKIITSPYVNVTISPNTTSQYTNTTPSIPTPSLPQDRCHHNTTPSIPIPTLPQDRCHHKTAIDIPPYDSRSYDASYLYSKTCPNHELESALRTPLPSDDEPIFNDFDDSKYQNCVPNTNISKVFKDSVHGVEGQSRHKSKHIKPKPLPRKSSFKEVQRKSSFKELQRKSSLKESSVDKEESQEVWQRRRRSSKEFWAPTRLPSTPVTPPAFQETDLNDNVFEDPVTSGKTKRRATESEILPLPDICSATSKKYTNADTKSDAPKYRENLKKLTVDEIIDVLKALKISKEAQQLFLDNDVDGELFSCLDEKILQEEFELSKFHSIKIMKYIKGWRPVTQV